MIILIGHNCDFQHYYRDYRKLVCHYLTSILYNTHRIISFLLIVNWITLNVFSITCLFWCHRNAVEWSECYSSCRNSGKIYRFHLQLGSRFYTNKILWNVMWYICALQRRLFWHIYLIGIRLTIAHHAVLFSDVTIVFGVLIVIHNVFSSHSNFES